jgi:hypothetical protein
VTAMHDDSQFLAAAQAAVTIVGMFGNLAGRSEAESIGVVTFLLLDLLKTEGSGYRELLQTRNPN